MLQNPEKVMVDDLIEILSTSVEATSYMSNATRNVWECRDISEYVPNYENFHRQYQFREKFERGSMFQKKAALPRQRPLRRLSCIPRWCIPRHRTA